MVAEEISTPIGDFLRERTFVWNGENVDMACTAISSGFRTVPFSNDNEIIPREYLEAINTLIIGRFTELCTPSVEDFRKIAQAVAENPSITCLSTEEYSFDYDERAVLIFSNFSVALPDFAGPNSNIRSLIVQEQNGRFSSRYAENGVAQEFFKNIAMFIMNQPTLERLHIEDTVDYIDGRDHDNNRGSHFYPVLEALREHSNLTSLYLHECLFTDEITDFFVDVLPTMVRLKSLTVGQSFCFYPTCDVNVHLEFEPQFNRFCRWLALNKTVTDLSLRHCSLGCNNLALLGTALVRNKTLRKLDLTGTRMDDNCANMHGLFDSIAANTSIRYLNFSFNNLTATGLIDLLKKTLTRRIGISKLDVSLNRDIVIKNTEDETFRTIMGMIDEETCTMKTLVLYAPYARVDREAAEEISKKVAPHKAVRLIQNVWDFCRWDPSFKICNAIHMSNLERDIGPDGIAYLFNETAGETKHIFFL
jgi:hypothetical protein